MLITKLRLSRHYFFIFSFVWIKVKFYFVPFLLIFVALNQLYLSTFKHLTVWKGAGFGMFSDLSHRFNKTYAFTDFQKVPIKIPKKYHDDIRVLKKMPSSYVTNYLRKNFKEYSWMLAPKRDRNNHLTLWAVSSPQLLTSVSTISVTGFEFELWSIRFDSANCRVIPFLLHKG